MQHDAKLHSGPNYSTLIFPILHFLISSPSEGHLKKDSNNHTPLSLFHKYIYIYLFIYSYIHINIYIYVCIHI